MFLWISISISISIKISVNSITRSCSSSVYSGNDPMNMVPRKSVLVVVVKVVVVA